MKLAHLEFRSRIAMTSIYCYILAVIYATEGLRSFVAGRHSWLDERCWSRCTTGTSGHRSGSSCITLSELLHLDAALSTQRPTKAKSSIYHYNVAMAQTNREASLGAGNVGNVDRHCGHPPLQDPIEGTRDSGTT